jgi:hypothetical protein
MGSAGFEPAASSAQGWHHTKLDNDPRNRKVSHGIVMAHIFKFVWSDIPLYTIWTDRFQWILFNAILRRAR